MEITCIFAATTGYDFLKRDLRDATAIVAAAMRKVMVHLKRGGQAVDIAFMPACHSTQPVFGYHMPGLNRRPICDTAMWRNVLEQLHGAHSIHPRRQQVGRGHYFTASLPQAAH